MTPTEQAAMNTDNTLEDRMVVTTVGESNRLGVSDIETLELETAAITTTNGRPITITVIRATPKPQVDVEAVLETVTGIGPRIAKAAAQALADAEQAARGPQP